MQEDLGQLSYYLIWGPFRGPIGLALSPCPLLLKRNLDIRVSELGQKAPPRSTLPLFRLDVSLSCDMRGLENMLLVHVPANRSSTPCYQ